MSRRQGPLEDFRLRHGNKLAIGFVLALAALFAFMVLDHRPYRNPNWGFGPEWECTPGATGGDPICIKKSSPGSN